MDWTVNPLIPGPFNPHGGATGENAWLMPLVLLGRYIALLVAPIKLSPDYGATVIGWTARWNDPYLNIGAIAIALGIQALVVSIRRRSVAGIVCLSGAALTYAMVGNIISYIGTNFAERLMFIPSAFLLILVGAAIARWSKPLRVGTVAVLVVLASWRTVSYAVRWNDAYRFYARCLEEQPESLRLHMLSAQQAVARGAFARSDQILADARRRWPESSEVWLYSAIMAMEQQQWETAQQYLDEAHHLQPSARTAAWKAQLDGRRPATRDAP
jgi:hypothetical protein